MNAPTEVSDVRVTAPGPVDAATDATGWWPWLTGGVTQAWESLNQMTAAWWSGSSGDSRILDLGLLDEGTQVRSRNFGDTMLVEVVSPDNRAIKRYGPRSDSIDTVRVNFDDRCEPMDIDTRTFDEGHLTYITGDSSGASPGDSSQTQGRCDILSQGIPIPSDTPLLPPLQPQPAVI